MESYRAVTESGEAPLARLESQLFRATVSAMSPKGIVKVVCNGHGDGLSMELKPGAKRGFACQTMSGFVTAAFRSADRAVDALHEQVFADAGFAVAPGADRPMAATDVARCFGRDV